MNISIDNATMPTYSFLPPTDDISMARLLLALLFITGLTISLSANVAQLVLQIYCRRMTDGYPIQHFITATFVLNAFLPLSLPPLILERLVNLWMFGPLSCNVHHAFLSLTRVIVPWTLLFINLFTLFYFKNGQRRLKTPMKVALGILTFLLLFDVLPQTIVAKFSLIDKSNHDEGTFIMQIQASTCHLPIPPGILRSIQVFIELILPFSLFVAVSIKSYLVRHDSAGKRILLRLVLAALIQFLCNLPFYLPHGWQASFWLSFDTTIGDYSILLPFIASSSLWLPLSDVSAILADVRTADLQTELRRSAGFPLVPSCQRSLLQPP